MLCGAGNADGLGFRRTGERSVEQAFATYELENGRHVTNAMLCPPATLKTIEQALSHSVTKSGLAEIGAKSRSRAR
jgi:hypothetical protein